MNRNLSPQQMFQAMAAAHQPQCQFQEDADFAAWQADALPRVLATLGDFPIGVDANPELLAEWEDDGLHKQRWIIDVAPHISATFCINYPPDWNGEKRAAILCWHGHGNFGKTPVMGNGHSGAVQAETDLHNYDYGHQMARAGFITFAIDWIGGGERSDANLKQSGGRDWCNLYYLHATMLGMTSLSINLAHGKAATDFATTLPGVDAARLGVMGLSGGGTMALWSALHDARFRASEVICYSQLWAGFGIRNVNYCGMQVAPGLYKLVDIPDLQGLLAPRPLLLDIGAYDSGFGIDDSMKCFHQVEKIYAAADASDKLHLDLFPGDHAWGGNKSVDFFREYLA